MRKLMLSGQRHHPRALLGLAPLLLAGCGWALMDVERLGAEGYRKSTMTYISPSGGRREVENYELWTKESQEGGRTLRLCLVPKVVGAGYNWRVTVFVEDKETWSYESGSLHGKPQTLQRVVDCTVSRLLPEGQLTWGVNFTYWE